MFMMQSFVQKSWKNLSALEADRTIQAVQMITALKRERASKKLKKLYINRYYAKESCEY